MVEGIVYRKNGDNTRLRKKLLEEQHNFCAYTEKRVGRLDAVEVEHFDRTKKDDDDYFNYYAVIREANLRKKGKERKHVGAPFFDSLFFQNREELDSRVQYIKGEGVYEETTEGDQEAADFIDYLGFNDSCLHEERARHIRMMKDIFEGDARFDSEEKREWFAEHPEHLSFVTAVEAELEINLDEIVSAGLKTR